tara:strand:- start:64 stop:789 length:726 start_codon:yes stop_codon:yes gene_type:complete
MSPFLQVPSLGGPASTLTATAPAAAAATFTFKYYNHGNQVGYWRWYWSAGTATYSGTLTTLTGTYDGTSTTEVDGEKQSDGNSAWKSGTIDLLANSISGTGRMVLLYSRSNHSGWDGDVAFQRMTMTINGSATDLSPPSSTSTVWKGQSVGGEELSLPDIIDDWEGGGLSFNTVNTTVYTNGPWAYRTGSVPSSCSSTGPCQEDGDDGSYYMFCETSSNAGSNMYDSGRYAFACTTNTFTI